MQQLFRRGAGAGGGEVHRLGHRRDDRRSSAGGGAVRPGTGTAQEKFQT